jgi:tetratricopeptide (TPR) repeat protein
LEKLKQIIIPLLICSIAGAIYLYTAAPAMLWEDAGSIVAATNTLGVNNPPTPVYVFIAHFFTYLPFGSVVFRLQIFSALLAFFSLFLLYQVILNVIKQIDRQKKLQQNKKSIVLAGLFGILTLAFSYEFWSQSQNTERFILVCFAELVVLYLLTLDIFSKKFTSLVFCIVFILGLSTGIDPVVLSFFPAVLLMLWYHREFLSAKKVFMLCITGLAGVILAFSYIPFASMHEPFLNYNRPTDLVRIWEIMVGQGLNAYHPDTGHINGFTGSIDIFFSSSWHFLTMLWLSFTPVLLPFILIGGWYLRKINRNLFWLFFSIVITNFFLSVVYFSGNQESWYLVSDIIFAIFAGLGYVWLITKLHYRWYALVVILLALLPLVYWWSALDRHEWRITDDYIHNLYKPITAPSIVIGYGDLFVESTYYAHDVLSEKTETIPVIENHLGILKPYRENLARKTSLQFPDDSNLTGHESPEEFSTYLNNFFAINMSRYKIYITNSALESKFIVTSDNRHSFILDKSRFKFISAGLLQKVVSKDSTDRPDLDDFTYKFTNNFPEKKPIVFEHAYQDELKTMIAEYAHSYVNIGDYLSHNDNNDQAIYFYQKALELSPDNLFEINALSTYYANHKQYDKALYYYNKAHILKPDDPRVIYNMAVLEMQLGKNDDAKNLLLEALKLANEDASLTNQINYALHYLGE